jgi:ATP synthase protein I
MTTAPATNGSTTRPDRPATVGGQVRSAALATLVLGVASVVAGLLLSGPSAASGAAVGFGMVLVFFGTGAVVVNAVATVSPVASLMVAILTYTLEVVLVALVFAALDGSGALDGAVDRTWAGVAVIAATLVWLVSHIISATRSRMPLYDLPERPSAGPSDGWEASAR